MANPNRCFPGSVSEFSLSARVEIRDRLQASIGFHPLPWGISMFTSVSSLLVSLSILVPAPKDPEPDSYAKGYLGVQLREIEGGVSIEMILPNSAASRSSLREGDRILKIEGLEIRDTNEARESIQKLRPGNTVEMAVKRGDQNINIRVKVGAKPE